MIVLACTVIIRYFYVSASGNCEFGFYLRLKISGTSVLYGSSESFPAFLFSFFFFLCLFGFFLQFLCVFRFCNERVSDTSEMIDIFIDRKMSVDGIDTAELCMPCLQFSVMISNTS